ncbi:signal peptidase II [Rhodococcus erythropolis]|uniref:signal peptidase II n=1 Tax=Rhodococcus erythropolis TaxID=1833 RepID=UPI00294A451F|nr:signal peptidase II [Rhodococcus erythropolis]MDV6275494.1 signal peptidase II [Rhodococcus erythropolis]
MSTDHPDRDVNAEDQPITEISKADEPETVQQKDAKPEVAEPEGGDPAESSAAKPRKLTMLIAIAAVILLSDILTKVWAVAAVKPGQPIEIIGDVVTFTMVRNPGAAFSMATSMTWILTLVAIGVVIGVIKIGRTLRSPWWALGLGLVLGGALGNLVDRFFRSPGIMRGHVVDFVSVGWWPVFNIADSAIVCGAILLVVLTLFGFEPNGERLRDHKADDKKLTGTKAAAEGETK